jgi:hypothetical protein
MREENMVVDELNRGVAVPALWVGSKIADVLPRCPIVEAPFEHNVNFIGVTKAVLAPFCKGEQRTLARHR